MITESFDSRTEPVFSPGAFYGERRQLCETCLVTFSEVISEHMLGRFFCKKVAEISACNGATPIYGFVYRGKRLAFYLSHVGATAAATDVIEANWLTGAAKFVMFGSAGALDRRKTEGKYVVPTAAYRDEGMSYHYAPPADYIAVPGSETVCRIFDELQAPYVPGRVWTTDAVYRETRGQVEKRTAEGCLAVEMELAGVQAVCDFHGFSLYDFLMTGDVLDEPEYNPAGLPEANHSLHKLDLALEIALRV
ncbi:MAG: nucleoside phosphorylase [Oscillospiraceae bacterium]